MGNTPFPNNSFDVVTGGYALRNAPDLRETLKEINRVLKPGGTAVFLDFSKPFSKLGQALTFFVLTFWGGLWGLLLHGKPAVYVYIAKSLRLFPDRRRFQELLNELGFISIRSRLFYFGLIEIIGFQKSAVDVEPVKD